MALFIPFVSVFYIRRFKDWDDETFEKRYGTLFDGLRRDTKWSLFYTILFMTRRLCFGIICIFGIEYFFL